LGFLLVIYGIALLVVMLMIGLAFDDPDVWCVLGLVLAALALVVGALSVVVAVSSARRRCPRCGVNRPRQIDLISDGGVWQCRGCGHEWQ
jgi:hypothetical protein